MVVGDLATSVGALVLGAGPGGYTAALELAQLGQEVTLIDPGLPGGSLRDSYLPLRTLLAAAGQFWQLSQLRQPGPIIMNHPPRLDWEQLQAWKNSQVERHVEEIRRQLDQAQVERATGRGRFLGQNEIRVEGEYGAKRYLFDYAVIAVGCDPSPWPNLPFDGRRVLTQAQALALTGLPTRLTVLGSDSSAAELATLFAWLGTEVRLLLPTGQRLLPEFDPAAGQAVQANLEEMGVKLDQNLSSLPDNSPIIISAGLMPRTADLALDQAGVKCDSGGFIQVNDRQQTSHPAIYAVGGVTGGPPLAHVVVKQGQVAAEAIAGRISQYAPQAIPRIAWTDPPVAAVGLTAAEAKSAGYQVVTGRIELKIESLTFNLQPSTFNLQPLTTTKGFIEVVAERDNEVLLGVTIVGPQAEAVIGEAALALEMGATLTDLAETLHPHLGVGEALARAARVSSYPRRDAKRYLPRLPG